MAPQKYRKKPVEIEAVRLTDEPGSADDVAAWCGGRAIHEESPRDYTDVYIAVDIPTLEGIMRASEGDYVIRGVQGEFHPCKPDIFKATYESA